MSSTPPKEKNVAAVQAVKPQDEPESQSAGLDDLTAGEIAMAERTAAQGIQTLGNDAFPQASLLGALGWVLYRRTDAKMRFDTYMASRTLSEITTELGLSTDEEPDEGKDDG